MQVILLDKVQNLGDLGEIVNVKNGYARNYLIPQKKASRATEENIKAFEAQKAELVAKAKESLAARIRIPQRMAFRHLGHAPRILQYFAGEKGATQG